MNKVADFNLNKLFIRTADGMTIPMTEVADVQLVSGPLQINRDETKRRIAIGVNVRDADVQQVVNNIQKVVNENIKLKPGYYFEYGGQFENLAECNSHFDDCDSRCADAHPADSVLCLS
jgi:cobalt-zinc-cadmium resistance protein CzcA